MDANESPVQAIAKYQRQVLLVMSSLKKQFDLKHQLTALSDQAVQQQIAKGVAQPSQLRQRRRHLLKSLRKRISGNGVRAPEKFLHSVVMLLALWGFTGLIQPNHAEAAAVFEHTMLEGFGVRLRAAPAFADIDKDGDLDAFVGDDTGTIMFYQNNGTASVPAFVPADGVTVVNPLDGVSVGNFNYLMPAFADIDGDGDLDVFIGERNGLVLFYRNTGDSYSPNFVAANGTSVINPLNGIDVGGRAAPVFVDIDGDDDLDAFIGSSTSGVLFYRNTGDASSPNFAAANGTTIINPMDGLGVTSRATPTFADIDNDGDLDAFVGNRYDTVLFYRNIGDASSPSFVAANGTTIVNPLVLHGDDINYIVPAFADIDNDGDLDAFVGMGTGVVRYYENTGSDSSPTFIDTPVSNPLVGYDVNLMAAPSFVDIDDDGDMDAFVGGVVGSVKFYQNNGSVSVPNFVVANGTSVVNPFDGFTVGRNLAPVFADIDDDGDLDAFVGEYYGTVKFYRNDGNASAPGFVVSDGTYVVNPLEGFDVGYEAVPTFVDIDDDGDLDAFIGEQNGTVKFYQNDGTVLAPVFTPADGVTVTNPLNTVGVGMIATPTFADIDHDGDMDAFVGTVDGIMKFYQNSGSVSVPNFEAADGITVINPLDGFNVGQRAFPTFVDIDHDGDLDAFVGELLGTVRFFENHEFEPAPNNSGSSGGGSTSSSGGGAPALLMIAALAVLIPWRTKRRHLQ